MKPTKGRVVIHRNRPGIKEYEPGDWPAIVVDVRDNAVMLFVFTPASSYHVVTPIEPIDPSRDIPGWFWPPREN